jgi:hypothetical protein
VAEDRHQISIAPLGGGRFRVTVEDGSGSTTHQVELPTHFIDRLGWTKTPEELIRRSFVFLLEREPKESILESFELSKISDYFPEYEQRLQEGTLPE